MPAFYFLSLIITFRVAMNTFGFLPSITLRHNLEIMSTPGSFSLTECLGSGFESMRIQMFRGSGSRTLTIKNYSTVLYLQKKLRFE